MDLIVTQGPGIKASMLSLIPSWGLWSHRLIDSVFFRGPGRCPLFWYLRPKPWWKPFLPFDQIILMQTRGLLDSNALIFGLSNALLSNHFLVIQLDSRSIVLEPSHASKGKVSLPRWPETPFPQPYHLQAALCSSWPAELPVCSLLSAFYVPGAYFRLLIGRPWPWRWHWNSLLPC